jgi:hypothetical protein
MLLLLLMGLARQQQHPPAKQLAKQQQQLQGLVVLLLLAWPQQHLVLSSSNSRTWRRPMNGKLIGRALLLLRGVLQRVRGTSRLPHLNTRRVLLLWEPEPAVD